jgi:iron(III) transport system ATP-binding protein
VRQVLDLVELPSALAGRYPHELSGGQQQRVALARALAPQPELVLLDEPFSSLDAGLREDTGRAVARALRASGATALLVTHDQGEALSLADQVAVMSAGRFLQVSPPHEIYLRPASPEVAGFMGHATLLPGTASGGFATCDLGRVSMLGDASGPVLLAVRPEQVSVTTSADGLAADVLDVSYFGHDATLRARIRGRDTVVIARVPAGGVPTPGDIVCLRVSGDVQAFPRSDG